jgi:hypothetical protein
MRPHHVFPGFSLRPPLRGYSAKSGHDLGDRTIDNIDAALAVAGEVSEELVVETVR